MARIKNTILAVELGESDTAVIVAIVIRNSLVLVVFGIAVVLALIVTIRGVVGYGSIYGQIKQSQVGVIESQTDGRMRMQKQSTAAGG